MQNEDEDMAKTDRRTFIKYGVASVVAGLFSSSAYASTPTPSENEGPFYPVSAQKDKDLDLTRIEGKQGVAKGKVIIIQGQVLDTDDNPIEGATVDLWQANAAGRYLHPQDTNEAPLDPNFQGSATMLSGKEGKFRFITIYPGAYPASGTWMRPPHIHFKVSKKGYIELVTQMYFPEQRLNDQDLLLKRKNKNEEERMIASKVMNDPETYRYNIILREAQ
jgi:protocatechuate 3,4-dioxygenase, beta subunit